MIAGVDEVVRLYSIMLHETDGGAGSDLLIGFLEFRVCLARSGKLERLSVHRCLSLARLKRVLRGFGRLVLESLDSATFE